MSFEIRVNGAKYDFFKSASVTRSIDNFCGEFTFVTSNRDDFPVNVGDRIQILINDITVLTGYVFVFKANGSTNGSAATIAGRDLTADLADSSIPSSAKNVSGAVSLSDLCKNVITGLGQTISVIDESGGIESFTSEDLQAGQSGGNAFSFLESFARKRQVYLTTNAAGNLVIYRPGKSKATSPLIHRDNDLANNVLDWDVTKSEQDRFGTYNCKSQDNFGHDDDADIGAGTKRTGESVDNAIRSTRYFEFVAEESMNDSDCTDRAKEESNIRRARGVGYNCTVQGVAQSDGSLWESGQLVKIDDVFAKARGLFLIRTITYSIDLNAGTLTKMVCTLPDAYTVQDVESKTTKRKAQI